MNTSARLVVTSADDLGLVRAYLGGTDQTIPVIEFGPEYDEQFAIQVHTLSLSPADQQRWLLSLSNAARALAADIPGGEPLETFELTKAGA